MHVADGLDARASGVHVADVIGIEHAEGGGGEAFGAEVDVRAGEGGGGDLGSWLGGEVACAFAGVDVCVICHLRRRLVASAPSRGGRR